VELDDHVLGLLDAEKPYIEIIDGKAREKLTPDWPHARAQIVLGGIFEKYAEAAGGETGSELRFVSEDSAGQVVTVLPDVSYYSPAQIENMSGEERYPRRPPYAAVEIRSLDDRPSESERSRFISSTVLVSF
jgi:Uma2 family endonuclease